MGKINQLDYSVNHGITQGNQGIGASQGQTVQQLFPEHKFPPVGAIIVVNFLWLL